MTTGDESPVPLLDLAPKLDRPLSLQNPLDSLRVLYWVFFFPQALRWYVEVFGVEPPQTAGEAASRWSRLRTFMRTPTPHRNLWLQGLALTLFVPVVVSVLLQAAGLPVSWPGVLFSVAAGVALDVGGGVMGGVAGVVAAGVMGGMAFVALGVAAGVMGTLTGSTAYVGLGVTYGIALGVTRGVVGGVVGGVAVGVARGVAVGMAVGVAGGVLFAAFGVPLGEAFLAWGVAFSVAEIIACLRLPDFLVVALLASARRAQPTSCITPLPLPKLRWRVTGWLQTNTASALANIDQLQRFTLQFAPVVDAVNEWLVTASDDQVLPRAEQLALNPYDWNLVFFASSSLANALRDEFTGGLVIIPQRWRRRRPQWFGTDLRFDTPARAACAGFWALHAAEMDTAIQAFANVRNLPGGANLHRSAKALNAAFNSGDLTTIATWAEETSWLSKQPVTTRESVVVAVVRRLRKVALEAAVARDSLSRLNRNAALSRSGAILTHLLEDLDATYPELVRPVTRRIAAQWRDVLSKAGGEIGQMAIDKPVFNPYVVGPPVTGQLFAGRETILRQLEELWGSDPARPAQSVVLYGHRRMGKTSILLNLGARFGRDTVVVLFTMQRVGRVRDTGELLHTLALTTHDALAEAGLPAPDEPDEAAFAGHPYRAFDEFLRAVRAAIGRRRVILTVDEFEAIEIAIRDGRIDAELLSYLRDVIHKERWLVVAFAGLHTLQEMTGDYWNPLHAGVIPIKVGFFSPATSANLLANPSDDFPLDFTREAAERVYDHVRGQPYLTQLVGHTLVNRYNNERFEQQQAREPRFTAEEVDGVVASAEFYAVGDGYFNGIWVQADDPHAPGQHALLLALARADGPATSDALAAAAGLSPEASAVALDALVRHDIVARDDGRIEFTVPLMRRWLQKNKLS